MIHAPDSVSTIHGHGAFAGTVFCIKKQGSDLCRTLVLISCFTLVYCNDLFLIIRTAGLAYSVGHHKSTAFAAFYQIRSTHLPVCSSLIASSFGRFILWTNRHRLHLLYAFSLQFVIHRAA